MHHGRGLRLLSKDAPPGWVATLARDYRQAELTPRQRALLDWAARATLRPDRCSPQDLDALRAHGLDDTDLLHAAEVIAYYAYANRIIELLAVQLEDTQPGDDELFDPEASEALRKDLCRGV